MLVLFYIPTSNAWQFCFFHIFTNICYSLFCSNHPSQCGVVSRCGSALPFSACFHVEHLFHRFIPNLYIFWRNVYLGPLPLFSSGSLTFDCWLLEFFKCLEKSLIGHWLCKDFPPSCCLFTFLLVSFNAQSFTSEGSLMSVFSLWLLVVLVTCLWNQFQVQGCTLNRVTSLHRGSKAANACNQPLAAEQCLHRPGWRGARQG